jgi:hypothetical protein
VQRKRLIIAGGAIALAVLVIAGVGFFVFSRYQQSQKQSALTGQQAVAGAQSEDLVTKVGKLIDLPKDETPQIATVSDVAKLQGQPFFQNAKNGDKVLIYNNNKKVILYDPNADKVINVAPLSSSTSSAQLAPDVKVVLRNTTKTSGLAGQTEDYLKQVIPGINVTDKDNSTKNYDKTTVVALNDKDKDEASVIAEALGATVADLPDGEKKADNADILVLIGKDRTSASASASAKP